MREVRLLSTVMARLYRFTSTLGFHKRGYVDITNRNWGTFIIRFGAVRDVYTEILQGGAHGFDCNHMPIIEEDQVRKALAFLREGHRLAVQRHGGWRQRECGVYSLLKTARGMAWSLTLSCAKCCATCLRRKPWMTSRRCCRGI
jgi:hypothetical protein